LLLPSLLHRRCTGRRGAGRQVDRAVLTALLLHARDSDLKYALNVGRAREWIELNIRIGAQRLREVANATIVVPETAHIDDCEVHVGLREQLSRNAVLLRDTDRLFQQGPCAVDVHVVVRIHRAVIEVQHDLLSALLRECRSRCDGQQTQKRKHNKSVSRSHSLNSSRVRIRDIETGHRAEHREVNTQTWDISIRRCLIARVQNR
jgi:hypothetical protein